MYVMIGYETEDEFEMDQFTASKLQIKCFEVTDKPPTID